MMHAVYAQIYGGTFAYFYDFLFYLTLGFGDYFLYFGRMYSSICNQFA